jgi:hypothetical protein
MTMSCNTGFHDRCGGCTCTCHPAPFDWSGTGQFDDLLNEVDEQEFKEFGPL